MIDLAALKAAASGRWPEILSNLGGIPLEAMNGKNQPCPKCGGKDRFRMIDRAKGALFCNQCFKKNNGDGLAAVMWLTDMTFAGTVARLAADLGLRDETPNVDPVQEMAWRKGVTTESLVAYGATNDTRGELPVCRVPMHDADMDVVGYFDLAPSPKEFDKGKMTKGSRHGLFVSEKPNAGDTVAVLEGVKDPAALFNLGIQAVGLPTCRMDASFASFFRGIRVVIIPDRDKAGLEGAEETAARLFGVAETVKIAELPADYKETGGADVRDVLHQRDGEAKVRTAIQNARTWAPNGKPQRSRKRFDPPPPWKPFPTEVIPEPVRGYIKAGAHAMRCDESFIALPMAAGLASAIGATHRIELKAGWSEPPVVWAAIVSESGTMKSPAQSLALKMLSKAQEWRLEEYPEMLDQYKRDKLLHEADVSLWKKSGRSKGEPPPEEPKEPQPVRYLVNDATIEALAELLENNPRGLLVSCDELNSWLGSFDQYRGGRGGDAAKWLSIHRAEGLIVDRKTGAKKTIFVKRAAVSVAGSIQPATLRRSLGDQHFENGLAARMLLASPPRRAKTWSEASVDRDTYKAVERVFGRLLALDFGTDDNGKPAPGDMALSPEAKRVWVSFYNEHATAMEALTGRLAASYAKIEAYAARLALVVHLVDSMTMDVPESTMVTISESAMVAGVAMAKWFSYESERVYRIIEETEGEAEQRAVVELIQRKGGTITARQLQQSMRRFRDSSEAAETALAELVVLGMGDWEPLSHDGRGGRPTRIFRLSTPSTSTEPQ